MKNRPGEKIKLASLDELLGGTNRQVKRLLLRGYGEIPIKINPIG